MTSDRVWWAGDRRMYDVLAIMRETRERETHMTDTKKIAALETTIANLAGDMSLMREALMALAGKEVVAKTATAPKVTGTSAAPLYVKEAKPTCQEPTCDRYGKKGFTPNGAAFHVARTGHKIS